MKRRMTDRDACDEDDDRKPARKRAFYKSGCAQFEILRNGETPAECWNKCQKYPDHNGFTAASDFTAAHLPSGCRGEDLHRCIKLMSDLTVRLKIRGTGSSSPIAGSSHGDNGTPSVTRMCTGFFSYFDIRSWASMFESDTIWKQRSTLDYAQTADRERFSDSRDDFDLDTIKQQIMLEMDSEEMIEFVRHFCCERLRHLCLLIWPAVTPYNDRLTYFLRVLTCYMQLCYENRPDEFDVSMLRPQDVIDNLAISSTMFRDDGFCCSDPTSTLDDATNNTSDDTMPRIPGDPTTNISDNTTTNISNGAATNISDEATIYISDDAVSNISGDATTNISDHATTNISDQATTNISDDVASNISGDATIHISDYTITNISGDATTNISHHTITNISGDTTTNISDDATTNISRDATTNISDYTITNISGDLPANISGDAATKISNDTTTNLSDDTTINVSDGPTTSTSADSTTTNVHNSPISSSYVKQDLISVYPCPCPECKSTPNPQPEGYVFDVLTDRRAVRNDKEAANTVVDLEFGGQLKHLYGQTVHTVNAPCHLQYLRCVTHELKLAEWIKDTYTAFGKVYGHVRTKVSRPLAVACSYPHGHGKMVSVGEWTARFSHDCGQTPPLTYVSYRYTTPTCPGSMGAPVLILGNMENDRHVINEVQSHYGTLSLDENKSGIGLALVYDL